MSDIQLKKKSIDTKNGKIFYYLDIPFPSKQTVIFLHGLSSNHTTWINIIKILHGNGYNSIALDLRGHGLSDKTKNKKLYELSVFSNDLSMVVENERINNLILVGYSFGGSIAIDYTVRYPEFVRGLVLISTNHEDPLRYKGLKFLTPFVVGFINLLGNLFLWQRRKNYHYYEHGKAVGYWDSVWDGLRTMPVSVNLWMLAKVFDLNLENAIRKIKVPTVIFYGKNDAFITKTEINDTAKAIQGAKVVISQNPDHFVGTNSQDETAHVILDFLKKYENSNL